jgi:hypothetical protein
LAHVAVIAESALQGDRGDGLVRLDQELADFADAKLPDVGRGRELKGFLEVPLKTADGHASKAGEIFHHHKRGDAGSRLATINQFELFLPFENFPGK